MERLTGLNLTFSLLNRGGLRIYVVGSDLETIQIVKREVTHRFPGVEWVGFQHGYFKPSEEEDILTAIVKANPDVVLAGLGFPKQEWFLDRLSQRLPHGIGMGIGGVLDVLAGKKGHAPAWIQKLGVEWIYHGLKSPTRIKRWGRLLWFCVWVIRERVVKGWG